MILTDFTTPYTADCHDIPALGVKQGPPDNNPRISHRFQYPETCEYSLTNWKRTGILAYILITRKKCEKRMLEQTCGCPEHPKRAEDSRWKQKAMCWVLMLDISNPRNFEIGSDNCLVGDLLPTKWCNFGGSFDYRVGRIYRPLLRVYL